MGLLDAFNSDEGLLGLSLLAAGAPRAGGRTSIGEGLLGALQNVQQRKMMEEDRRQKAALLQAQMAEIQAQVAQRAAAVEQAQRQAQAEAAFRRDLMPAETGAPEALAAGGGPTVANAAKLGQSRGPDLATLALKYPDKAKLLQELAGRANWGREEVSNVEGVIPGTNMPATLFRNKFGDLQGQPVPKAVEMKLEDLGGTKQAFNPFALQPGQNFAKTNTPDAMLSAQTTMRGQNMTDARAREKNANDLAAAGKVEWKQDVNGNWVGLPKEVTGTGPVEPVTTTVPSKRETQSKNALDIIKLAEEKISKGTSSYAGAAADQALRVFGASTKSADAAAELRALEGALMMAQPRMEGPQSNYDVQLYRQMAASIGDPTVPVPQKRAALDAIKKLHTKYAGNGAPEPQVRRYNPETGRIE